MERFYKYVEKTPSCWNWKGSLQKGGYGQFWFENKQSTAHRSSWIIHKGIIPKGICVCHKCDNRNCVNPDHLFLATHKENTHDMMIKGRKPVQDKKLTQEECEEISDLYTTGTKQRELAKKYGTHQKTVWREIHKKIPVKTCIGEENNKSKLNKAQVLHIRSMYKPKVFGSHRIAKIYSVDVSTIKRILNRKTWKHI